MLRASTASLGTNSWTGELFDTLWEVQVLTEQWRHEYNHQRPHSALGYRPPAPEAILTSSAPSAISVS